MTRGSGATAAAERSGVALCAHTGGSCRGVRAVLGRWRLGAIVGAHRAVLGRFRAFGAVRAVSSSGSCVRTRGEVRKVRAVSSRDSCGRTRAGGNPPCRD